MAIEEYQLDSEAIVTYRDEIEDGMPHMGASVPVYQKEVLHQYNCNEEEDRKYLINY